MKLGAAKLLLVEDDPSVRTLTKRVLVRYGYQVHVAADGEEALRIASVTATKIE